MSMVEIMTLLYFKYLNINPDQPLWEDRDRVVVSKGHAGVGVAPVLANRGYFPKEELSSFNQFQSRFGMHLDALKVPGVDVSTGSLGHGLPHGRGPGPGRKASEKDLENLLHPGGRGVQRGHGLGGGPWPQPITGPAT